MPPRVAAAERYRRGRADGNHEEDLRSREPAINVASARAGLQAAHHPAGGEPPTPDRLRGLNDQPTRRKHGRPIPGGSPAVRGHDAGLVGAGLGGRDRPTVRHGRMCPRPPTRRTPCSRRKERAVRQVTDAVTDAASSVARDRPRGRHPAGRRGPRPCRRREEGREDRPGQGGRLADGREEDGGRPDDDPIGIGQ